MRSGANNPERKDSLQDWDVTRLDESIIELREAFPHIGDHNIREVLMRNNGNRELTYSILAGSPGSSSSANNSLKANTGHDSNKELLLGKDNKMSSTEKIHAILQVFPGTLEADVREALSSCGWDVDKASEIFLDSIENLLRIPEFETSQESSLKRSQGALSEDRSRVKGFGTASPLTHIGVLGSVINTKPDPATTSPKSQYGPGYNRATIKSEDAEMTPIENTTISMVKSDLVLPEGAGVENLDELDKPYQQNASIKQEHFELTSVGRGMETAARTDNGLSSAAGSFNSGLACSDSRVTNYAVQNGFLFPGSVPNGESSGSEDESSNDKSDDDGLSYKEKMAILSDMFPGVGRNYCNTVLLLEDSNLAEAIEVLTKEIPVRDVRLHARDGKSETDDELKDTNNFQFLRQAEAVRAGKRRIGDLDVDNLSGKKARKDNSSSESSLLEPAGEWVIKYYGESTGRRIRLDDSGVYPCRFPRVLLGNFVAFRDMLEVDGDSDDTPIPAPSVEKDVFELAIQWAICRQIKPTAQQSRTPSIELTTLIDFVMACQNLGLNIGILEERSSILDSFKSILRKNRKALEPQHVKNIYTLSEGHPLRRLIVEATLREFVESKSLDDDSVKDTNSESDGEGLNEAQRIAYGKNRWRFQREFNLIKEFRLELSELFSRAWMKRGLDKRGVGRGRREKTFLTDPLSGERFIVA